MFSGIETFIYSIYSIYSMANDITTIQLTKRTRDELAKLGNKDETFEDIIISLMKKAK